MSLGKHECFGIWAKRTRPKNKVDRYLQQSDVCVFCIFLFFEVLFLILLLKGIFTTTVRQKATVDWKKEKISSKFPSSSEMFWLKTEIFSRKYSRKIFIWKSEFVSVENVWY